MDNLGEQHEVHWSEPLYSALKAFKDFSLRPALIII